MSEGKHDSNGRVRLHPDAVADLATETASKLTADERWIERVDEGVAEIRAGKTDWQKDIQAAVERLEAGDTPWHREMKAIAIKTNDHVLALTAARILWPSAAAFAAFFLGGFTSYAWLHILNR